MHLPSFLSLIVAPITTVALTIPPEDCSTSAVLKITKVTPFYWRAIFSDPPFNIQGDAFFRDFYDVVDQITGDPDVKVVVFESGTDTFFSTHVDLVNTLDPDLWPGNPRYWESVTRLANSSVLTVAAIRGIAYNAGAEIAAVMDVRFGSKEKATFAQTEVGFGKYSLLPNSFGICILLTMFDVEGANPGGGGIEFLSRLAGRSRALEIVLGADVFDADTAALYGCK